MKSLHLIIFIKCFLLPQIIWSQQEEKIIADEEKMEVVNNVGKMLSENYVFPEKAKEMVAFIKKRQAEGLYEHTQDPLEFSDLLTKDLQSISNDLHIRVRHDPKMIEEMTQNYSAEKTAAYMKMMDAREARENFGFKEVKMLSAGVGYLKLDGFSGSGKAGETAAAAMNFLAGSEALIIDLRQNGGGSPDMIQFLSTYLFDHERVHLNSFYNRPEDETTQRWTLPFVPGKRLSSADVYVLTSGRTFSAAEEFSYNLKNLKRATLVGETTGGGAHPGGMMRASKNFAVFVPTGRAINPITGTNWEGTGVEPHIQVSADQALDEAHFLAVEKLDKKYASNADNPYGWAKAQLKAVVHPCEITTQGLVEYEGDFGPRKVTISDGKLFYQREQGPKSQLICMEQDLFMMQDIPYFRLKFLREESKIVAVEGIYEDGHRDKNRKVMTP